MGAFTVTIEGGEKTFQVGDRQTILEAAEEAGLSLDFGCRHGVCSVCKVQLVQGEADQAEGEALMDDEIADGYLLVCVGRPKSDLTLRIE